MPMVGAISLTAPLMLGGLALVALPIAAHLLHRRAKRRVVFPSIMLLAASSASQSSLFKLRRWLLLALRCLAVALIALAFAQPLWRSQRSVASSGAEEHATVVLLDVSASAGQVIDGVSLFEWLRSAAARAAEDAAAKGRRVDLIPVDHQPRPLFPQMTSNIEAVRSELARLEPSAERANPAAAFAEAGRLLESVAGERELVIVSDLQASNWSDLVAAGGSLALPAGVRVTLATPPAEPPANAALVAAAASPGRPFPGRSAAVTATVANFGPRDQTLVVTLKLANETAAQASVFVEAGGRRDVSLPFRVNAPGHHALTIHLPNDGLPADNTRHLAVHAVEHQTVALVTDGAADRGSARYFTSRALAPRRDGEASYRVQAVRGGEVSDAALADTAGVVVMPDAALDDEAAAALERHLRNGGGVIVFAGDAAAETMLRALAARDLLPASPRGIRDATDGETIHIGAGDWRSPLLRAFDARAQEALSRVAFRRVLELDEPHPEAAALLRFEDNRPALLLRPIGRGQLLLAAFSPAADASDLAKHGSFVALLHNLVAGLAPDTGERGGIVGQPLRLTLPAEAVAIGGVQLIGPDASPLGAFDLSANESSATLVAPRPRQAGFYSVERGGQTLDLAAANVDPRESDLRRVDPAALRALLAASAEGIEVASSAGGDAAEPADDRPLWGWTILAAMGVLAVELGLLSWWRR